jgi:hypothetical protein
MKLPNPRHFYSATGLDYTGQECVTSFSVSPEEGIEGARKTAHRQLLKINSLEFIKVVYPSAKMQGIKPAFTWVSQRANPSVAGLAHLGPKLL